MANIPKLRDEHFRLMATVRRLGLVIEQRKPPPPLHLLALRHELSSTLIAHLQEEDWLLYPQLVDSRDGHIAATARTFREEMGGLADAYVAHCQRWTAVTIIGDWPGYCCECRQILDALTIRITRENRELFPLLETIARAA
jgi:iron-sulfur cluster repair protein YtfE (RIC family)